MAIPSRPIGQGPQAELLWNISKQMEQLICATCGISGPSGTSGTSGLSGDKYLTTSSSSFELGVSTTLTVGTGLSYTVAQDVIIAYDIDNHQTASVLSYDPITGVLIIGPPVVVTGSGTYSSWIVNLDGAAGGNGTSGTSGLTGTSGTSGVSGSSGTAGNSGTSGTSPSFPYPLVYGLYSQTSSSLAVTNTTTETTIIGSGVGNLSVPANGFSVGDSFLGRLVGHISSRNNDTIRIQVKSGAVILGDTGLIIMPQTTSKHYTIDLNFTVRTIGAAGVASIATGIVFTYSKDASNAFEGDDSSIINNTTFDTTSSNTLDVTVTWGAADPLNSIYSEYFTLNKVY